MAKVPNFALSRYTAQLRGQPNANWAALALQEIEAKGNQVVAVANSALVPSGTATSAVAGTATALPAQPVGYTTVTINGEEVLIPYYKKG